MEHVKKHFNDEAKIFDDVVKHVIPHYDEMIEALTSTVKTLNSLNPSIIDLGTGTGTIAKLIKEKYPESEVSCLDFAENMIQAAREKLSSYKNVRFLVGNIFDFVFDRKYDAVISSLAIHHLDTDESKKSLFKRIYETLNDGGIFYNADVVLANSELLQEIYLDKWGKFMQKSLTPEEIEATFAKYRSEDHPSPVTSQIEWLKEAGFKNADVIWKHYNFAVYGGVK